MALLKGVLHRRGNPNLKSIVLLDDWHPLVRYENDYTKGISCLRELFWEAKDCVFGAFTGTPLMEVSKDTQLSIR